MMIDAFTSDIGSLVIDLIYRTKVIDHYISKKDKEREGLTSSNSIFTIFDCYLKTQQDKAKAVQLPRPLLN